MQDGIRLENLTKSFQLSKRSDESKLGWLKGFFQKNRETINAIDEISLSIKPSEIVGLIGPNGAGKSTTIKIITGILLPDSGTASVFGLNPWQNRIKIAKKIGVLFGQKSRLLFHLPPIETFKLHASLYEVPRHVFQANITKLNVLMGIANLIDIPTRKLSLGQRMRCEIALSLIHSPDLLLLDEPTIGLDLVAKKSIIDLIKELNIHTGITVLYTSHDMNEIEKICHRIVVLNHGKVVADKPIENFRKNAPCLRNIEIHHDNDELITCIGVQEAHKKSNGITIITIDTEKIEMQHVLTNLFSNNKINDLSISFPPLEDIILQLYDQEVVK